MSRLSFRPRPLDIHKKLPIVKSIKDFEDDDGVTTTSTRSSHLQRIVAEADNEVRSFLSGYVLNDCGVSSVYPVGFCVDVVLSVLLRQTDLIFSLLL